MSKKEDIVIGIDLGTTYSCVAVWNNSTGFAHIIENEEGFKTTASWVSFVVYSDSGESKYEIIVGDLAKNEYKLNIENTVYDVKRLMGKRFNDPQVQENLDLYTYKIKGDSNGNILIEIPNVKDFKPEEISAMILEKMKRTAEKYLGHSVTKAVITVPAYFNDAQRQATKNASIIAGLDCIRIINEPTSACLCYGLDKRSYSKVLIFDLGGGTFDVSVLELVKGSFNVLATNGNVHLGGEDFDKRLCDYFIELVETKENVKVQMNGSNESQLKEQAEKIKKQLSVTKITKTILTLDCEDTKGVQKVCKVSLSISRLKFEELCSDLFNLCFDPIEVVLKDAELQSDEIDEIILVGGSTRIPKIQEMLSKFFNGKTLNTSINPDEAVAYGASIQGAILGGTDETEKTKDIVLVDVIPLSLGIKQEGGIMSKLIKKNSGIPTSVSAVYTTVKDYQKSVLIEVYEGEREFVSHNHFLGSFTLDNIQTSLKGVPKIEVTFSIDENGILNVKAIDKVTYNFIDIVVENNNKLSQEEISKMIDDAEKYRAEDQIMKDSMEYKELFHKYLDDCLKDINNAEYAEALTDDERSYVNQLILNNKTWLDEDNSQEGILTKEFLEETHKNVQHILNEYINKIYSRKLIIDSYKEMKQNEGEKVTMDDINSYLESKLKIKKKLKFKLKV